MFTVRSSIRPNALNTEEAKVEVKVSGEPEAVQPVRVWEEGERSFLTARAPQCAILIGHIGGRSLEAPGVKLILREFDQNFASMTLVARDGRELAESGSMLLTLGARFNNHNIVWTPERNSLLNRQAVGRYWWGEPPVVGIELAGEIRLRVSGPRRVFRLDACGGRIGEVAANVENGELVIPVSPDDHTIYYEITSGQ